MDFKNLKYIEFLKLEFSDRLKHKGFGRIIWNLVMFPCTSTMNYFIYRKWIKVKNTINNLIIKKYSNIEIFVKQSNSLKKGFSNYGKNRLVINSNQADIIQTKNHLFIFPISVPNNINDFYTIFDLPFRIKIDNQKEEYKYIEIPTVNSINKIEINNSKSETKIDFISPDFDENIELTIREKITINTRYSK